jgi:hypothetical protein
MQADQSKYPEPNDERRARRTWPYCSSQRVQHSIGNPSRQAHPLNCQRTEGGSVRKRQLGRTGDAIDTAEIGPRYTLVQFFIISTKYFKQR